MSSQGPLRIVLFGLPRAGKTALLAALSQCRETQPSLLPGVLEDPAGGLGRQRQQYYDETPRSTEGETVAYPVRLQTPEGPLDVEFIDCDGRVVLDLLNMHAPLEKIAGNLPRAVLDADALLLVTDPTLKPELADRVLAAFDEFLRRHEQERGRRNDVVGLPVFVVLTKADLLAEEKDGLSDWMGRIEEQKRAVRRRLHDFIDDSKHTRPTAFGRLDVHVWATAMKRPALRSADARPRDPYNVAELFRQCLTAAKQFRQRQQRADHRLGATVQGLSGVATVLALVSAFLFSGFGQRKASDLEHRVERYRLWQGTTIEARLHDWPSDLEARREELKSIAGDDDFSSLPEEVQAEVHAWAKELDEYIPYLKKVLQTQLISTVRTERQLKEIEQRLGKLLALSPEKEQEWEKTGAVKLRKQRLDDVQILREQTTLAIEWYQERYRQGDDLRKFRRPPREGDLIPWREWQQQVEEYLTRASLPPEETRKIPAHSLITPMTVIRFDKVRMAREAVIGPDFGRRLRPGIVQQLEAIRDISFALGLIDPTPTYPSLLVLPRNLSAEEAFSRWRRLESHPELATSVAGLLGDPAGMGPLHAAATFSPGNPLVPPYPEFETMFTLEQVADLARPEVIRRAGSSHVSAIEPLRHLVMEKYKRLVEGDQESPERWKALADWLIENPAELRPYRRLALVLDRLRRPNAIDPVAALVALLTRKPGQHAVSGATLTLPFDLRVSPPESAILRLKVGATEVRMTLTRTIPEPQERRTHYTFTGEKTTVTFQPGDAVTLTLPLRNDRVLTWSGSRTATFAYEALSRQPWLHRANEPPTEGSRTEGVVLKLDATPPLPAIPDLLPSLR